MSRFPWSSPLKSTEIKFQYISCHISNWLCYWAKSKATFSFGWCCIWLLCCHWLAEGKWSSQSRFQFNFFLFQIWLVTYSGCYFRWASILTNEWIAIRLHFNPLVNLRVGWNGSGRNLKIVYDGDSRIIQVLPTLHIRASGHISLQTKH